MADIAFNWSDMESDLSDPKYSMNFITAELANFTEWKKRSPENIWIIRKRNEQFWLLARLSVDEKIAPPKNKKKHWITYDPNQSSFYSNPFEIQSDLGEALIKIGNKFLIKRKGNGQGPSAGIPLNSWDEMSLKNADKNNTKISLSDFVEKLKTGPLGEPYKKLPNLPIIPSVEPIDPRKYDKSEAANNFSNADSSSFFVDGSSDSDTDQVTPSVNSEAQGSHRQTSPEEDEERRKKQVENGARGEEIAMQYEVERLKGLRCPDPLAYIKHESKENNNAGYDIFSGWNEEETRYIEVKASEKGSDTFFISSNEVEVLKGHGQKAWIYMIDLSKKDDCVTEIGSPGEKFDKEIKLEATQYRASLSGSSK